MSAVLPQDAPPPSGGPRGNTVLPGPTPPPSGFMVLELLARLHKVAIDNRALVREFGLGSGEPTPEVLLRILKAKGFRARIKQQPLAKLLQRYPLPLIQVRPDGGFGLIIREKRQDTGSISEQRDDPAATATPDTSDAPPAAPRLLCFVPGKREPQTLTFAEVASLSQTFIVVSRPLVDVGREALSNAFGLGWFWTELASYKGIMTEIFLGSFLVQSFGLFTPLFTQVILDKVLVHRSITTLEVMALAFLGVAVFECILNLARQYLFLHTANKLDAKLGAKVFRHLFALPYRFFEDRKVGHIVTAVREMDRIREFVTQRAMSAIIDVFFSFIFVVVMFIYSTHLTLLVLGFLALISLLMALLTPLYRKRLQGKFEMGAQANATLVELVGGVQTVKALAIEGTVQRQWEDKLAQFLQSGFRLSTLASTSNALTTLLQKLLTLTILFVGVMMVLDQKLSVGQLIAFNMFTGQLTGPVLRLAGMWNEFQQTLLAVDRLGDILNQPVESAAGKAVTLPRLNGHVQFDNVGFRYHPDLPRVLSGLSLDIPAGSSLGIVGPSGSGKSTLAKLVQRLYTAQEGVMYIDGVDVRHFHPHWLRYQIGVVLQESVLFSGTIAENIALPRPDAPFELILEASRAAGAHEFITQLPEGYETPVGERGASLSGGQRQRIAIARALITQPRLLIMDEATSALDAESERFILGQMDRIKKGRTVLIIAHRLAAVRACDRIVVLDRGQVTESGTHAELMALNGLYTQLHRHQAGEDGTA